MSITRDVYSITQSRIGGNASIGQAPLFTPGQFLKSVPSKAKGFPRRNFCISTDDAHFVYRRNMDDGLQIIEEEKETLFHSASSPALFYQASHSISPVAQIHRSIVKSPTLHHHASINVTGGDQNDESTNIEQEKSVDIFPPLISTSTATTH